MNTEDPPFPAPAAGGSFPTTHWSMVLHAGAESSSQARSALESLCLRYWYPLYVFVRRQGRAHHEAEDCIQEFLSRLLQSDGIAQARPAQGKFRTFLLSSLRNFLTDEWRRDQAEKRGGGQARLPLEFQDADQRFSLEPVDPGITPDEAFDRSWALGLIDQALAGLRAEYAKSGRGALFESLVPLVWGNAPAESLAEQAARLELSGPTFTVALHRLRRRLGERLRTDVAETVAAGADIDIELRYLMTAVGGTR